MFYYVYVCLSIQDYWASVYSMSGCNCTSAERVCVTCVRTPNTPHSWQSAKTHGEKCQIHPANGEPEPRPLSLGSDGDTARSESNQANPIRNRYRYFNRSQMRGNGCYLIGAVDRETGTIIPRTYPAGIQKYLPF